MNLLFKPNSCPPYNRAFIAHFLSLGDKETDAPNPLEVGVPACTLELSSPTAYSPYRPSFIVFKLDYMLWDHIVYIFWFIFTQLLNVLTFLAPLGRTKQVLLCPPGNPSVYGAYVFLYKSVSRILKGLKHVLILLRIQWDHQSDNPIGISSSSQSLLENFSHH